MTAGQPVESAAAPGPVEELAEERIGEQAIRERDEAEQWADRLAAALGGEAVGEHSSANNPWANALELAAERDDRVRAEERQRIATGLDLGELLDEYAAELGMPVADSDARDALVARYEGDLRALVLAAGSAVPVAAPGTCEHGHHHAHKLHPTPWEWSTCPGPAATPTQPAPTSCRHGRVGGCGLDGITESYPPRGVEDWPVSCPSCGALAPNLQVVAAPPCGHWFHDALAEQDGQR